MAERKVESFTDTWSPYSENMRMYVHTLVTLEESKERPEVFME
jgi:hypothetical protein